MAQISEVPLSDRKRFAVAYAFCKDRQGIDWDSAAAAYDSDVLPQSFKTVTQKALKKANADEGEVLEADINRFALCYIFSNDRHDVDWQSAATAYDPKVKHQSFRTVTQKALKKVSFAPGAAAKPASKTTEAKKRKSPTNGTKAASRKKTKVEDDVPDDDVQREMMDNETSSREEHFVDCAGEEQTEGHEMQPAQTDEMTTENEDKPEDGDE